MMRFQNGPAHDRMLSLKRAPIFLRVVRDPDGKIDALDLLSDEPEATEAVYAYRCVGEVSTAFVDGTKGGKRCGWVEQSATYAYMLVQPPEATMRDTNLWQSWCRAKHSEEEGKKL